MKIRKQVSLLLFVALLLITLSNSVSAEDQNTLYTDKIQFSHDPQNTFTIEGGQGYISLTGLPSTDNFRYIWVWLTKDGSPGSDAQIQDSIRQRNDIVKCNFTVPDGTYYLSLYSNSGEYGTYKSSIWGKDFPVVVSQGKISFPLSPVYENNKAVYDSKSVDLTAQEYYLRPTFVIQSDDPEIIKLAKKITADIPDNYSKARAIHDWVAENIYYDYAAYNGDKDYGDLSATGVLNSRIAVCQGYAQLTAALLQAAGIPAKVVTGFALVNGNNRVWSDTILSDKSNSNHAWNEAFVDGRWIIIDTTWDSGNEYYSDTKMTHNGMQNRKYFDISLEAFSLDHRYEEYSEEDIYKEEFVVENGSLLEYNGKGGYVVIPAGVKSISADAFYNVPLDTVIIPSSVTKVDPGAFKVFVLIKGSSNLYSIQNKKDFTIIGAKGSAANKFAKEYGIRFTPFPAALPTSSTVFVDGVKNIIDTYLINGSTYFRLNDIAFVLKDKFDISYEKGKITIIPNALYTVSGSKMKKGNGAVKTAAPNNDKVYVNDKELALTSYTIDGYNYFKLSDLAKALDFEVDQDGKNILIEKNESYKED